MAAPYPVLSDRNLTEGLQVLFIYANDVSDGTFGPALLIMLFLVVAFGSFFATDRLKGRGDMAVSFAVAGYITTGAALILFLISGIVNLFTVVATLTVSVISTFWLFNSKDS